MAARVVPIINQKGGVGKTTACRNLAFCLKERGFRVLIIDMDAQRNTDRAMSAFPDYENPYPTTMFHVLNGDCPLTDAIFHTAEGIDLIRADERMYSYRSTLITVEEAAAFGDNVEAMGRFVYEQLHSKDGIKAKEAILQRGIESISGDYDYILIDTNPVLGDLLTIAILASSVVYPLIPIFLEISSYDALVSLNKTLSTITRNDFNRQIIISGLLVSRFENTNIEREIEKNSFAQLANLMHTSLYKTRIPRAGVLVRESFLFGKSVIEANENAKISLAYQAFCDEFLQRMDELAAEN